MTYIEQLITKTFKPKQEILVDANELQRLARYAVSLENKLASLEFKIASLEIEAERRYEKVKLYA